MREVVLASLVLAALPALLYTLNVALYRPPRRREREAPPAVSLLIPARDEEATLAAALDAALASEGVELEVVVLDDGSTDATAAIAAERAARDHRVQVATAPPLPPGWCGKPHACWRLAELARHPVLVFQDADVRLAPDALRRMADSLDDTGADLASGVPHQETGSLAERMLVPLIHFILLGYLPLPFMRWFAHPAFAAGCGQLFAARRDAYFAADGHRAVRASLHDGLTLPAAFRRAGRRTDLFDATELAVCRMYDGGAATWRGLGKNAVEGMAAPGRIGLFTLLLLGGHVAPVLLFAAAALGGAEPGVAGLAALAAALSWAPRLHAAVRFRQSLLGALLHPLAVALLVAIQWQALARHLRGRPAVWRGRAYGGAA